LWALRPLQDGPSCPDWIKRRDPGDLPEGWPTMEQAAAVRTMRGWIADKARARAVQHGGETPGTVARGDPGPATNACAGAAP